jgi:hypothetical protein
LPIRNSSISPEALPVRCLANESWLCISLLLTLHVFTGSLHQYQSVQATYTIQYRQSAPVQMLSHLHQREPVCVKQCYKAIFLSKETALMDQYACTTLEKF